MPEQQQQWRAALERAEQRQVQLLAERGGKLWSPSWELLDAARDERMRQLS